MRVPLGLKAKCSIFNTLIASKFRNIAGGRLRLIASGGAPLDQRIAKVLHVLGINIMEGYGLTETSPIVCCHTLEDRKLGTVGKPLDGVEVAIGEKDEILVKGPNVMKGYLNKPEETGGAMDKDGWFHTGDKGRFDADGNLLITGRIKELIVTSYGKKIAPAPIEARMTKSRYIAQAVLHGDKRKYLVALVVPCRESIQCYARDRAIFCDNYSILLEHNEIKKLIDREIEGATADLASYEKVRAFALLSEEFSVENDLLTPTLKLRKGKIMERYQDVINALYDQVERG
jgi:long-chain acyl-CoA synthetase